MYSPREEYLYIHRLRKILIDIIDSSENIFLSLEGKGLIKIIVNLWLSTNGPDAWKHSFADGYTWAWRSHLFSYVPLFPLHCG